MADQSRPEIGNLGPQSSLHPDSLRVRNALSSVSNGAAVSLPLPSLSSGSTAIISSGLKKLGQRKKDALPITMVTKPVTVVVKNRFKHTKPNAHVIGTDKQKNALEALSDTYSNCETDGPPAKQCRIEPSVEATPRSVITPAKNISALGILNNTAISICPSCRSKNTTHISNGVFKCNNCSRSYVPLSRIQTVSTTTPNLVPAATFYSTSPAGLAQKPTLRSSAVVYSALPKIPKMTRAKKQTETIDLVSSDEGEDEETGDNEGDNTMENTTQETTHPTVAATTSQPQLPSNMPNGATATTTSNNTPSTTAPTRVADRMRLKGGESSTRPAVNSPSPSPSPESEYVFNCHKVMFGELYGHSLAPVKVMGNRMYLSLECVIVRENVQSNEKYTLSVGSNDVEQILVYFGRVPSFVAIETAKKFASVACKRIGKEVLVPGSEHPKKRYILLALKSAFKNDFEADTERRNLITVVSSWARCTVLSHLAAELLIKQAQLDVEQKEICYGRTAKAQGPIETLLIYPQSLKSGGIPITTLDVACLDEGTYLNDIIIDFYLTYIKQSIMTQEQRDKTYIFNSYFYKRLTHKSSTRTDPTVAHSQVKKWTRNVDIFEKDFVIIPINEHCHWYLAIICFHGQPLVPLDPTEKEEEEEEEQPEDFIMKETTTTEEGEEGSKTDTEEGVPELAATPPHDPAAPPSATEQPVNPVLKEGEAQQQQTDPPQQQQNQEKTQGQEGQQQIDPQTTAETAPTNPTPIAPVKQLPKQANELDDFRRPCILIFDSLVGSGHSRVFTNLRNYLTQEWKHRKPSEEPKTFDKESMKGCYPKIPRQNNDCDCGVFLLQYSEFFFSKPIRNYRFPINLQSWFTVDSVTKKREDIKTLIAKLTAENKSNNTQKQVAKPKKKAD